MSSSCRYLGWRGTRIRIPSVGETCGRCHTESSKGSYFYFHGRAVHRTDYVTFHRHGQAIDHIRNGSPSLIGYVPYSHISGGRRNQFEPCPGPRGAFNHVCARISQKRLTQIVPNDWSEDPYFVCLLLALAQLQERKVKKLSKPVSYIVRISFPSVWPQLMSFQSRLLVNQRIHDDYDYIHLYEAEITAELLGALKNPNNATTPIEWPTIRWKKLPFKPYDTFANRVVAELVAPIPLRSGHPSGPTDDVHGDIIEHGMKRPHEPAYCVASKKLRIS